MTKVEELREQLLGFIKSETRPVDKNHARQWLIVDSLIAAAEARGFEKGKVEGAEQERERILGEAEEAKAEIGHVVVYTEFEGTVFIIPASVLSPAPKENP